MASGFTHQTGSGEVTRDHLKCFICDDYFRDPRVLDCLHKFCRKCLQELHKQQQETTSGSKITCPLCTKETMLNVVTDLPQCSTLSALVEEFMMQEQMLEGQGSEIKCQACDEENSATSICTDCNRFLCRECQRAHERLAMMKSHKVYTLAQLRSGETAYRGKPREVPKCGKHPDQNFSIYCNTCEQLICTTCSVLSHGKHSLIGQVEALDKCKQDAAELTAALEKNKTALYLAKAKTDKSFKKLHTMFAETNRKIAKKANEDIAKITKDKQELRQDAKKFYENRVKIFETAQAAQCQDVSQAEHVLGEANQLIGQASPHEFLQLKQKLFQNLKELIQTCKQPVKLSAGLSFMDFEEGEQSLGRLVLEDEPELKSKAMQSGATNESEVLLLNQNPYKLKQSRKVNTREQQDWMRDRCEGHKWSFGGTMLKGEPKSKTKARGWESQPVRLNLDKQWVFKRQTKAFGVQQTEFCCAYDVAAFSDNEIVVADTKHKQLIKSSLVSNPLLPVVSRGLQIEDLANPSHVSVNNRDQLIVLDGNNVKTFSRQYQLLDQFKPGRQCNSQPTCLAVDEDNLIAVGYKFEEEISLHKPDGSLIKRIDVPMIFEHLAVHKQRLVYTTFFNKMLSSIDYSGAKVFSADMTSIAHQLGGPNGVCCESDGSIYVAERGFAPSTSEIHHFSPDGEYIDLLKECGIHVPWGITLTPDSDFLIVAAGFSVKAFHHS